MKFRKTYLILFLYFLILWIFLNIWGIDALQQKIDFEFYADSETYMEHALSDITFLQMAIVNPNLIGPVYLSRLLLNNYNLIFFFNSSLLFLGFHLLLKNFRVNSYLLLGLLLFSPMVLSSILSLNKEILGYFSTVLLIVFIKNNNWWYLVIALIFAFLVRWQHVAFTLLTVLVFIRLNPFRKKLALTFVIILLLVSSLYPLLLSQQTEGMMRTSERLTNQEDGSGIFFSFNNYQNIPFGYCIVFIPKLIFTLFSLLSKISLFGKIDGFYNYTIVLSQCVFYALIVFLLIWYKKVSFKNKLVFIAFLYCLLFTLSPIFAPRYLFIFYVIGALIVSEKEINLNTIYS
jgi:hypothetical protein